MSGVFSEYPYSVSALMSYHQYFELCLDLYFVAKRMCFSDKLWLCQWGVVHLAAHQKKRSTAVLQPLLTLNLIL